MKTFIFIPGLRGPEGQFIYDEGIAPAKKVLFKTEVEDSLTLDQAILKFKGELKDDATWTLQTLDWVLE